MTSSLFQGVDLRQNICLGRLIMYGIQGGPKVGLQLKVGLGQKNID